MTLLHLLSYVATVAAFLFVTLSLASGLLWLSELIEEHTKVAKVIGKRCIYVIISIHVLLSFTDALPFPKIAFSILCHVVYLQNFSDTWPLISLTSQSFVASCCLVVADHFLWFFHFTHLTHQAHQVSHHAYRGGPVVKAPAFADMATFFGICVWLTPLFLFLSLSANDNTLPTMGPHDTVNSPSISSYQPSGQRPRASLFRLMLGYAPNLRRSSSRAPEGLIAPSSPGIPQFSPRSPFHAPPLSPRTPTRSSSYGDIDDSASTGIKQEFLLSRPPPRRTPPSHTGDGHSLGHPLSRRRGSEM